MIALRSILNSVIDTAGRAAGKITIWDNERKRKRAEEIQAEERSLVPFRVSVEQIKSNPEITDTIKSSLHRGDYWTEEQTQIWERNIKTQYEQRGCSPLILGRINQEKFWYAIAEDRQFWNIVMPKGYSFPAYFEPKIRRGILEYLEKQLK